MQNRCCAIAKIMLTFLFAMNNMDVQERIREIKKQLRLFMNGVASQSMRDRGLEYRLNFGVEVPRLKEIAATMDKDHELAQALWKENIRECKILAGLLQPLDTFYPEIAEIWMEDMHYPELAELSCINLFQYLPYASEKMFEWIADERDYFQYCGYMIMAHLLMKKMKLNERSEAEFIDQAFAALQSEALLPQKGAFVSLCKFIGQSRENARKIKKMIASLHQETEEDLQSYMSRLKIEAETWA